MKQTHRKISHGFLTERPDNIQFCAVDSREALVNLWKKINPLQLFEFVEKIVAKNDNNKQIN